MTNKKSPGALNVPQRPNAAERGPQSKVAAPVQHAQRAVAPPVYRPQIVPKFLQGKRLPNLVTKASPCKPVTPPIYHPQPAPRVLQTKPQQTRGTMPPVQKPLNHRPPNLIRQSPAHPTSKLHATVQAKPLTISNPPVFRPVKSMPSKSTGSMVRAFRSSVINLMPEVAARHLQTALTYAYSDVEPLLQADERTELDDLWGANYQVTKNTSNASKNKKGSRAAARVKTRLDAILTTPLVTYSANFTTNHLSAADVTRTTAKQRGEIRDPLPPHNTVFKESYLRGLLIADATTGGAAGAAKADGEQWLRFQSPHPANGRLSLATRNGRGGMDADDTGLYFVAVKYELSTVAGSRRQKRIRAFHIETDDD